MRCLPPECLTGKQRLLTSLFSIINFHHMRLQRTLRQVFNAIYFRIIILMRQGLWLTIWKNLPTWPAFFYALAGTYPRERTQGPHLRFRQSQERQDRTLEGHHQRLSALEPQTHQGWRTAGVHHHGDRSTWRLCFPSGTMERKQRWQFYSG